jgi:hypothetical protein
MPYQAEPQIMRGTGGHSQLGWRATYVMSYDGGLSWEAGGHRPQKWRPFAWWAVRKAKSMARRDNAKRARWHVNFARESAINDRLRAGIR